MGQITIQIGKSTITCIESKAKLQPKPPGYQPPVLLLLGPNLLDLLPQGLRDKYDCYVVPYPFKKMLSDKIDATHNHQAFEKKATWIQFYSQIIDQLATQTNQKIVLIGPSTLGLMADLLAEEKPKQVAAAIGLCTPPDMSETRQAIAKQVVKPNQPVEDYLTDLKENKALYYEKESNAALDTAITTWRNAIDNTEMQQTLLLGEPLRNYTLGKQSTAPFLLITGKKDVLAGIAESTEFPSNYQVTKLPGGHSTWHEHSTSCQLAIETFFKKVGLKPSLQHTVDKENIKEQTPTLSTT